MGDGAFRPRLRFLRFRRSYRYSYRHSISWVNNAPRAPPIPSANRMSDASSALFTEEHRNHTYPSTSTSASSSTSSISNHLSYETTSTSANTLTSSISTTNISLLATPCIDIKSTSNQLVDAACVICLQPLNKGDSTLVLPDCGHCMWHAACIRKWFRVILRCPLCAANVSPVSNCSNNNNNNINNSSNDINNSSTNINNNNNSSNNVNNINEPVIRRRTTSASSQDVGWVLFDRRRSLASRPSRRRRHLLLSHSRSNAWR